MIRAFDMFMAVAAAETGYGDSHAAETSFPPFDPTYFPSQLFWLTVTFLTLLFLLAKVFLPRLGGILEDRSNHIADDLDSAARMQREAEAAEKAYLQSLSDARAKAHNVAETTRASITAEVEKEMAAADERAAKQLAAAEVKINALREKALANVDGIAAETSQNLIEALYGGKVSASAALKAVKAQN